MRKLSLKRKDFGPSQRLSYQENEMANAPIVPNPVEYEDIDNAFCDFFKNNINMVDDNGKKFDTYTFFSNQRFSEFSQTWEHNDEDGNLLMNFFAISRDNNPNWGNIQGGSYNIPGNNRFTVLMREIIDDTGVECYEITSMSQPIQVDIKYRLSLITAKFKYLNEFNTKANSLFSSKQCYLNVNGHNMPMILDDLNDASDYTLDGRKFYIQTMDITLLAYIIPRDDLKVELKPKKKRLDVDLDRIEKTLVTMDYDINSDIDFTLKVKFSPTVSKVNFKLGEDAFLLLTNKENANKVVLKINNEEFDINSKIKVEKDDEIMIRIIQPATLKKSQLIFSGRII